LGDADYSCQSSESANIKFRRSLYFVKDLNAGDIITAEDIRSVRPGYGMAPKHFEHVIGQRVIKRIEKNSPVQPSVLTNA
jgi:N-acetylneuraminate synthase